VGQVDLFQRFPVVVSRSRRYFQRLLTWVVGAWILSLCLGTYPRFKETPVFAGTSAEGTPGCRDLLKIATWSEAHFGGKKTSALKSQEFAERAAKLFVEKLDPYRVLFAKPLVDRYQASAAKAWPEAIEKGHCDFFTGWVKNTFPKRNKSFSPAWRDCPWTLCPGKHLPSPSRQRYPLEINPSPKMRCNSKTG